MFFEFRIAVANERHSKHEVRNLHKEDFEDDEEMIDLEQQ